MQSVSFLGTAKAHLSSSKMQKSPELVNIFAQLPTFLREVCDIANSDFSFQQRHLLVAHKALLARLICGSSKNTIVLY